MMSNRYALVQADGLVANVVEWDGVEPWTPPEDLTPVEATAEVCPGWRLDDGDWLPPEAA